MDKLKEFNPKLYQQIKDNPEKLLELESIFIEHEKHAQAAANDEAIKSEMEREKAEVKTKPKKQFSLPIFWHWFAPAFNFTAACLISAQSASGIPWLPFIIGCGFGVRLCLAPLMFRQMALINKMSHASPNMRIAAKLFKFSKMPIHKRIYHTVLACVDFAKQTNTSLLAFYFYNIIQIPVFILMVLSIRKISTEQEDMAGAGILWFKDLNEPDAYLILPIIATVLNYVNLGVSLYSSFSRSNLSVIAWDYQRE